MRPRSRLIRIAHRTLMACALTLSLTSMGCSDSNDKDGTTVQAATEAEITAQVNALANQIVGVIGDTKLTNPTSNAAPCENNTGDDSGTVNYVLGTYQIPVPNDRHQAAFTQVRDHWRAQKWDITEDRFNEAQRRGSVSAKEPTSGSTFTLSSSASPKVLTLLITSACYRDSAAG
jgi:hypothetical protein